MVRPPTKHTLIKCDVCLNASQNYFGTQVKKRCKDLNNDPHSVGQQSKEIDIPSLALQSLDFSCISYLRQHSGALTDLHFHLFFSDLFTAWLFCTFNLTDHSELILTVLHFHASFLHMQMWRNTSTHNSKESKKADMAKLNGSTAHVVCAQAYLFALMCDAHVYACTSTTCIHIHICKFAMVHMKWKQKKHLLEAFSLLHLLAVLCQTLSAIKSLL